MYAWEVGTHTVQYDGCPQRKNTTTASRSLAWTTYIFRIHNIGIHIVEGLPGVSMQGDLTLQHGDSLSDISH